MKRRDLLQSMAAGSVVAIVPTRAAPTDACDLYANALANALREKHGFRWNFQVDRMNEFVLFYREVKPKT
ncbi:hypothetical protein [Rhizobium leguminosarum]